MIQPVEPARLSQQTAHHALHQVLLHFSTITNAYQYALISTMQIHLVYVYRVRVGIWDVKIVLNQLFVCPVIQALCSLMVDVSAQCLMAI